MKADTMETSDILPASEASGSKYFGARSLSFCVWGDGVLLFTEQRPLPGEGQGQA